MHLVRFRDTHGRIQFGVDNHDQTATLLEQSPLIGPIRPTDRKADIQQRLAPIDPPCIYCVGLNYREHARETGAELPRYPLIFMKPPTAVQHPDQPIRIPACCTHGPEVDYECELAVVIGKTARNVSEQHALEHVLGYTAANDVSARWWQKTGGGGQWIRGKGFDTFCPLGPTLVTAEQIPDPQSLDISTTLNGRTMQQHNTGDMIFSVAQLIAFLSQDTTLAPGTVILTGTPQGVGVARNPQVFLKPGDQVTVQVQHIGQLHNPVTNA